MFHNYYGSEVETIREACKENNIEVIEKLILSQNVENLNFALEFACEFGQSEMLKKLIACDFCDPNRIITVDTELETTTILINAFKQVARGDAEYKDIVYQLFDWVRCDLNIVVHDYIGEEVDTIYTVACRKSMKSEFATTFLEKIIESNRYDFQMLLRPQGGMLYSSNAHQSSIIIACRSGRVEIVEKLIRNGYCSVNALNGRRETALMEASRLNNPELVKILIELGGSVTAVDRVGRNALDKAVETDFETIATLMEAGCMPGKHYLESFRNNDPRKFIESRIHNFKNVYQSIMSVKMFSEATLQIIYDFSKPQEPQMKNLIKALQCIEKYIACGGGYYSISRGRRVYVTPRPDNI